jgi:hypothetical protein
MYNEKIVAKFKSLFHHLPGGAQENHEKIMIAGMQA